MSISRANRVKPWFNHVKVGDSDLSSKTICSVALPLTKVWRAVVLRPRCGAAKNMISLTGIRELLLRIISIFALFNLGLLRKYQLTFQEIQHQSKSVDLLAIF